MDASRINLMSLWSVMLITLSGSLWLFTNIAWASDVDRIEVRLIKRDLRDLRHEIEHDTDPALKARIEEDIQEAIDALCDIKKDDRECKK